MSNLLGPTSVALFGLGSMLMLADAVAVGPEAAHPTTVLSAFIAVSVGAFSLLGWVVKRLFDANQELTRQMRELHEKYSLKEK